MNFVDIWTAFAEVIRVAFRNAIDAGLEVFTAKWTRADDLVEIAGDILSSVLHNLKIKRAEDGRASP